MITRLAIAAIRLLSMLPLPWVRRLGSVVGHVVWIVVAKRRAVVDVNLRICFPLLEHAQRRRLVRTVFVRFAQAWMDRGWLWHGSEQLLRQRLSLCGQDQDIALLRGKQPVLVFAPHFIGLDAGWTTLALYLRRPLATLYTRQSNAIADAWVAQGRQRWGEVRLFRRIDGPKPLLTSLRAGSLLYLLPDMDFGPRDSVFVPFFDVPVATVTSLSRFARLGRAKVVPVLARMTPEGYQAQVMPAWSDFPSDDALADTVRMNRWLEEQVQADPQQYYWLHRRFKTRPPGESSIY
jgi:Kdo2-lipid IVA lauroyltransferase/acyltransferase